MRLFEIMSCTYTASHVVDAPERAKYRKCISLRSNIESLGFETTGAVGKNSDRLLCEIGQLMSHQTGDPKETTYVKELVWPV